MTDPSTQPASALDDLTARARIRDAALALFAERGFAASSIREIAKAAGVSPGLVQHHFGTKDALREACDAHAVVTFRETRQSTFQVERLADPGFVAAAYARTLPVVRYLARALAEGSRGATLLFDQLAAMYREEMAEGGSMSGVQTSDPEAFVTVLAAQHLGAMVLHRHISRRLGEDMLTSAGHPRVGRAMLEISSQTLASPLLAQAGISAFATFETAQSESGGEPGESHD
jgi:AcrR family transcriptional regulator